METSTIWFIVFLTFLIALFFVLRIMVRKVNQVNEASTSALGVTVENDDGNIESGEPDIPKASIAPADLGAQFVKWLHTDPPPLTLNTVPQDAFTTEYVYLQAFAFDFAAYLKLGDSYEKKVVLDVFWDYITGAGVYTDTFQLRMLRYTDAVKESTSEDFYDAIGAAFADSCGAPGDIEVTEIGSRVIHYVVGRVNSLFDHITIDLGNADIASSFEIPTM